MPIPNDSPGRPNPAARAAFLAALALISCVLFPASHGIDNVQEGLRVLPAIEMTERGEWIVPYAHDVPYLAKPPLIYWCTRLLMPVVSAVGGIENTALAAETAARLVVGISGLLGAVLTYLCGRSILSTWQQPRPAPSAEGVVDTLAERAAFFGGCSLVFAPLFVHQSRTAEIDIMIAPLTIAGLWCVHGAWRERERTGKTDLVRTGGALAAAALLGLAKGPPGLLVFFLALLFGPLLHAALTVEPDRRPAAGLRFGFPAMLGVLTVLGFLLIGSTPIDDARDVAGVVIAGVLAAGLGVVLARLLSSRARLARWWKSMLATHPVGVPLAGIIAPWLWMRGVASRLGENAVGESLAREAADNVRVFVPDAAAEYAEAWLYAAGLGSAAAVIALVWLLRDRPRLRPGWFLVLAWAALPVLVFGLTGRGTARYITGAWPGVALLGGLWMAHAVRDLAWARVLPRIVPAVSAAGALAMGVYYALLRPDHLRGDSPRELLLDTIEPGDRVATLGLLDQCVDVYVKAAGGEMIGHFHDEPPKFGIEHLGVFPRHVERTLAEHVGRVVLLAPVERDAASGLFDTVGINAEPIETNKVWNAEGGRTPMRAYLLRP